MNRNRKDVYITLMRYGYKSLSEISNGTITNKNELLAFSEDANLTVNDVEEILVKLVSNNDLDWVKSFCNSLELNNIK